MKTTYQIIVQTNSYAGNFERELCAYMTGQIGECRVGREFVNPLVKERFDNKVISKPDDYNCYRPVALDDSDANNIIIFLENKLSVEDIEFLTERAIEFERTRHYEYLDPKFKFLGLKQIGITSGKFTVIN